MPNKEQKARKLLRVIEKGDVAIAGLIFELEEKIDAEIPQLKNILERIKGDKGDKGDNYKLTQADKKEIANIVRGLVDDNKITEDVLDRISTDDIAKRASKLIKVPKVKDGKTPTKKDIVRAVKPKKIAKQASKIAIQKIRPLIPEMPIQRTIEEIRDGFEALGGNERLDVSAIKGLEKVEGDIKDLKNRPLKSGASNPGINRIEEDGVAKWKGRGKINFKEGIDVSITNGGVDVTVDVSEAVLPNFTQGSVLFGNGTGITEDNTNFFWDDGNNRLGIGVNTPAATLDVSGDFKLNGNWLLQSEETDSVDRLTIKAVGANSSAELFLHPTGSASTSRLTITDAVNTTNYAGIAIQSTTTENTIESIKAGTGTAQPIVLKMDGTDVLTVTTGGNVGIGTQVADEKLAVTGVGSFSEAVSTSMVRDVIAGNDAFDVDARSLLNSDGTTIMDFFTDGDIVMNHASATLAIGTASAGGFMLNVNGDVKVGNLHIDDNQFAYFGSSDDSYMAYDGSDLYIESQNVGSGDLILNSLGGNVGIGTSSPGADVSTDGSLVVAPNSRSSWGVLVEDTDGERAGGIFMASSGGGAFFAYDAGEALDTLINGESDSYLNAQTGNFGVGTANPDAPIHMENGTRATFVMANTGLANGFTDTGALGAWHDGSVVAVFNQNSGTNGGIAIQGFTKDANTNPWVMDGHFGTTGTPTVSAVLVRGWKRSGTSRTALSGTDSIFGVSAGSGSEVFNILADGNVGIGTTAPQSLLDVQGDAGAAGIMTLATKELTVVDGDKLGQINFNAPLESSGTDAILVGASIWAEADDTFAADNNTTDLVFATGASETATEKMRIDSAGNVGIGTTVPSARLHVDQDSATGAKPVLTLDQADIDDTFINFVGTSAADGTRSISSDTTEDSAKFGAIRVEINGTTKWIRIYDDES